MNILTFILSILFISCNSTGRSNNFEQKHANKTETAILMQTDTFQRPIQVVFKDISEIRMGSPYNTAKVELVGTNKIQLPDASWQDKYAWSGNSTKLVLVKWDNPGTTLVFRLFIINIETGATRESIRMLGAVNSLKIVGDTIHYNKFYYDKGNSKDTLCCTVDEIYKIPN